MDLLTAAARGFELASRFGSSLREAISSNAELEARMDRVGTKLGPYGVDPFGFDPEYVKKYLAIVYWVYSRYFRCETFGIENVPDGPCLLVANHSGQLPFDAAMITAAVFLEREPPRYLRSMIERFVPSTPFVSTFMARSGQILGTPENCLRLLDAGEAILVFPEGVGGLNKTFNKRYQLQEFGQGFLRLALAAKAPIVPVGVIGAEEQAPSFYNARSVGKLFGVPSFPVTPTNPWIPLLGLLPYPTRYRIYFGEPIVSQGNPNDEDEVVLAEVEAVRQRLQSLINDGLAKREHVFW